MPSGAQIVFQGDSMSTGYGGSHPPDYYITLPQWNGANFTKTNIAVQGRFLSDMLANAATEIDPLYASNSDMNVLYIYGGTNDIGNSVSGIDTYSMLVQLALRQKRLGWRVIVCTLQDMSLAGATIEGERLIYNLLIRRNWQLFADGMVDIGVNEFVGLTDSHLDETYWQSGGGHPNDTGYEIIGDLEELILREFIINSAAGIGFPREFVGRTWWTQKNENFSFYFRYNPTTNGMWLGQNSSGKLQVSSAGGGHSVSFGNIGDVYFQGWNNAERPSVGAGVLGYNTQANKMEYYNGSSWVQF